MTSLLGRLLRLFPESVPLEDLFTEAIARLFETRPQLCLAWLKEARLITPRTTGDGREYVQVASQRPFAALKHHDADSRPDLLIEVHRPSGEELVEDEAFSEVVIIESKVGSKEGSEQLRRYAEHLEEMTGFGGKLLVYITRIYDPKNPGEILSGLSENVRFEQLRWHDFYRFLVSSEGAGDALVKEVLLFMEEQGMAMGHRFSSFDLFVLAALPRAFEIFDETLGGEVKVELESFAGNKIRRESVPISDVRRLGRYANIAPLRGWDLFCLVGYELDEPDGYPTAVVGLQAQPRAVGREVSVAAMRQIALHKGWETHDLEDPSSWAGAWRSKSLAEVLHEEDHVAAVKHFFIESIRQIKEELTAFKKEHPDLPWAGK